MSNVATRKVLTDNLDNCERGAFPGSAARAKEAAAILALDAFDRAYPEVLRALRAPPPPVAGPTVEQIRLRLAANIALRAERLAAGKPVGDQDYAIANQTRMLTDLGAS